jgi:polysaccharide export outer membrane protein
MLVHSLFDFNLQVPSTALLFLLICAIASVAGGQIHKKERMPAEPDIASMTAYQSLEVPTIMTERMMTEKTESAMGSCGFASHSTIRAKLPQSRPSGRRVHRPRRVPVALSALLVLAGWLGAAQAAEPVIGTQGGSLNDKRQEADRNGAAAGSTRQPGSRGDRAEPNSSGGDYVLEPTDVIEVHIEDAPELSKKFAISSTGTISMEYLKTIMVGGKTCQEVEAAIADGLRGRYLRDPHVTVTVLQSNSRSYYIQGAVRAPGVYVVAGRPTLMKLLTIAGGLADNHGSTAFIIREIKNRQSIGSPASFDAPSGTDPDAAQPLTDRADNRPKYDLMKTNINGLFRGDFSQDLPVQPGDIINIPQTDVFFVAGEVRKPGSFPLKDGTTLQQAISMAEGTTFKAATGDARIFRDDPGGKRAEIRVDVGAVMRGKTEDLPILANDIIVVPNSRTRSAIQIMLQGFGASALRVPVP